MFSPQTLTIGIATRGRRKLVEETALQTLRNVREKGTKIVVLADHDDDLTGIVLPEGVTLSVEAREASVGAKWNRMLKVAPADVYMAMCDYRYQSTPGFDTEILRKAALFKDGIGCVYQNLANLSFPAYQCVTAEMARIMGGVYVEHFPYWFVDHWLDDVCRMTGRFVNADGGSVILPRPGDGRTQDFREPGLWATLYDALYLEREQQAEALFAAMDEPDWRKDMLRAQWPLVHQRSMMLNRIVRGMTETDTSRDARYLRIRENGIRKLMSAYGEIERRAA